MVKASKGENSSSLKTENPNMAKNTVSEAVFWERVLHISMVLLSTLYINQFKFVMDSQSSTFLAVKSIIIKNCEISLKIFIKCQLYDLPQYNIVVILETIGCSLHTYSTIHSRTSIVQNIFRWD